MPKKKMVNLVKAAGEMANQIDADCVLVISWVKGTTNLTVWGKTDKECGKASDFRAQILAATEVKPSDLKPAGND
jgi:hypothetical protein